MVLLIDTNILLDVMQQREPHFASSFKIWGLCEYDEHTTGYISAMSPLNIAYVMRKELTPERMQDIFFTLAMTFKFEELGMSELEKAADIEKIHADYIITRNTTRHDTTRHLDFCPEEAGQFRRQQLDILTRETDINGNYEDWYEALRDFRKYIYSRHIKYHFGEKYRYKVIKTPSGDVIDHHIMSYFAPLNFKRTGWDNKILTPVEQIAAISEYFRHKNTRFIYAALPNKCSIYPEIICGDLSLMHRKTINVPQWRKYLRDVMLAGVEVIDLLPVFMKHRESSALFSKDHHVSPSGANREPEKTRMCFVMNNGVKVPYWVNDSKSRIAIFGDCNLQSYTARGMGILANLAYDLQYPVYNAGRKLIFCGYASPVEAEDVKELAKFDIVIYTAFASAPFVRTSLFSRKHPFSFLKWSNITVI